MRRAFAVLPLLLLCSFAAESHAAPATSPSLDCGKARERVEKIICKSLQLSQLDAEAARLNEIMLADKAKAAKVREDKAAYIGWRNQCTDGESVRGCIITVYAEWIHRMNGELRKQRRSPLSSISMGPLVYKCIGIDEPVLATLISSEPNVAYVTFSTEGYALERRKGGDPARMHFAKKDSEGESNFIINGTDVSLQVTGGEIRACALKPAS